MCAGHGRFLFLVCDGTSVVVLFGGTGVPTAKKWPRRFRPATFPRCSCLKVGYGVGTRATVAWQPRGEGAPRLLAKDFLADGKVTGRRETARVSGSRHEKVPPGAGAAASWPWGASRVRSGSTEKRGKPGSRSSRTCLSGGVSRPRSRLTVSCVALASPHRAKPRAPVGSVPCRRVAPKREKET